MNVWVEVKCNKFFKQLLLILNSNIKNIPVIQDYKKQAIWRIYPLYNALRVRKATGVQNVTIEFAQALQSTIVQTVLEYHTGPLPLPRTVDTALKVITLITICILYIIGFSAFYFSPQQDVNQHEYNNINMSTRPQSIVLQFNIHIPIQVYIIYILLINII